MDWTWVRGCRILICMKTLDQWLTQYSVSHQNKTNQQIHKLCVPLIFFSVLGMLWDWQYLDVRAAYVVAALGMAFYIRLGTKVALLMLAQIALFFAILTFWSQQQPSVFLPSLGLLVFGWAGQFLGHKVEGKKPSFFEDLQFLLIGPIWVFAFLFKR
jgi:uncharacterized membrane protein YGL010W